MRFVLLTVVALALAACGGAKVVKSYDDADYDGQMTRLLVLLPGLFPNANDYARKQLVDNMEKRGISVATRDEFFRASERLTREKLIAVVESSDVDGVLLVDIQGMTREDRGRVSFQDARGSYYDFEDEIGYLFSMGGSVAPVYRETQTDVFLRLRLFPSSTKRLAWERFLDFSNPGSAYDLIDKAAPAIAAQVSGSGLVAKR